MNNKQELDNDLLFLWDDDDDDEKKRERTKKRKKALIVEIKDLLQAYKDDYFLPNYYHLLYDMNLWNLTHLKHAIIYHINFSKERFKLKKGLQYEK